MLVAKMIEEWTEKYRPKSLSQVVGNESAIRAMKRWADQWSRGTPKKKTITLKGVPGSGKTSSALALANDYGWDVVEMNASDHRNAASIRRVAGAGSLGQTFTDDGEFLTTAEGRRKLIVIDEADNLFGREDYGGAKAIVETIRQSSQPIILIVNDYYALTRKASAVKTLADKADFHKLGDKTVVSVLAGICAREDMEVDELVLRKVAGNAAGDLRGAINDLQMLVEGRTSLAEADTTALGKRNQETELEAALDMMFAAETAKDARNAALDIDRTPEELILWVEENIPREFKSPEEMAAAFDALSRSDIYLRRTRMLQHYGLWSYARELMTSGVSLARTSPRRHPPSRYGFPSYLIMMSRSRSIRGSRAALSSKLSPLLHCSIRRIGSSVLPFLSILARNDSQLLARMGAEADLDEGDIAFLLGTDPSSDEVADVMAQMKKIKSGDITPDGDRHAKDRSDLSRSLADF